VLIGGNELVDVVLLDTFVADLHSLGTKSGLFDGFFGRCRLGHTYNHAEPTKTVKGSSPNLLHAAFSASELPLEVGVQAAGG
jgi:hypothetical protein